MQIVIDIDADEYTEIKEDAKKFRSMGITVPHLYKVIETGTVLPKNHGRLIDAEQLMNYCQNQIDGHKYADCNVITRFPIVLNAEVKE